MSIFVQQPVKIGQVVQRKTVFEKRKKEEEKLCLAYANNIGAVEQHSLSSVPVKKKVIQRMFENLNETWLIAILAFSLSLKIS